MKKSKEFYRAGIKCWNCGEVFAVDIPKGKTIDEFANKEKCFNCGCNWRLK